MTDKRTPRTTPDPWTKSVHQKEQQGKARETHDTKKLQNEKDSRRRDDQEERPHGGTFTIPRGRG